MKKLRVAVIGLGNRGGSMIKLLADMKDVEILYVCDSYEDRTLDAYKKIVKKQPNVKKISDYKEAFCDENVEAVLLFTSWRSHIPLAIEAMKKGKLVGTEVGGAYSVEDCLELVRVSEETKKGCMMLENCCYGKYELMVKKMVEDGKFGTVVHCAGGYLHDLRDEVLFGEKNRHYRLHEYLSRNCENYPTHELGPIAKVLGINDGNRMLSLTSTASKSCGLHTFACENKDADESLKNAVFKQGDVVTTVITCENGETITLTLNTTLPRFYSRAFTVCGTKGMYQEDGNILYLDGFKYKHFIPQNLLYNSGKRAARKYPHPLWKNYRAKGGHGGMDYLVLRAFVESALNSEPFPIDVYDTAAWMVITPLSEKSIRENSAPQEIPDFTNGAYKNRTDKNTGKYRL